MTIQIPKIELGNVVAGARFWHGSVATGSEVFRGHVEVKSNRHAAYIKVAPGKQVINELIATTIGRSLNLPIPKGYLLRVRAEDLPDSKLLKGYVGDAMIFGSRAMNHPDLARRFTGSPTDAAEWLQHQYKSWDETTVFDDWTANIDRNIGNFLIGPKGVIWLIDHGQCLTGPNWGPNNLKANEKYLNKLANTCVPTLSLPQRVRLREKAAGMAKLFATLDRDLAMAASLADKMLSPADLSAVKDFLGDRLHHLVPIISDRVGIPSL